MISVVKICLVLASFFIISLMITPAKARCSPTKEITLFDPNNTNSETCKRCPKCPRGKGLSVQCGSRVKNGTFIGCQNCENGTYSDHYDRSDCKSCDRCGHRITLKECTAKQNSICSTKDCIAGYYMHPVVDDCKLSETPTKTNAESIASSINNRTASKSLLPKNVTLTPTVSTKPEETTELGSRKEDERTKPRSQPMNSTTASVGPGQSYLAAVIGGILVVTPCFIVFIVVKFKRVIHRIICCIRREGSERGEKVPLTIIGTENHLANKGSNESVSSASVASANDNGFNIHHIPEDVLVNDAIVTNVFVMDELARKLDQPDNSGSQHWKHLAAEFQVPQEVQMKCQRSLENSLSKNMFENKEADDPNFSVQGLKDGLKAIGRNDLVLELENVPGTTLLQALNSTTFGNICLKLDQSNNWKDLGRKINIPDETLQKIATSTSPCTAAPSAQKIKLEAVLEIIGNKNPGLTVKEMKLVLKEMRRTDVCDVLEDLLQDNDTINTLRANINYVGKIAPLLDKEIPGMDNWMHFAHKFGLSKEICDSLKPKGTPSPTRALLEHIVQVDPGLTVKRFIEVLIKMERMDVVDALGNIICARQETNAAGPSITCITSRNLRTWIVDVKGHSSVV